MFKNEEARKQFFELIENGNAEAALQVFAKEKMFTADNQNYKSFISNYQKSKNKDNWLKFWDVLLDADISLITADNKENKKLLTIFFNEMIEERVSSDDDTFLLPLFHKPKWINKILNFLASISASTEFVTHILSKLDGQLRAECFQQLVKLGTYKYNGILLQHLRELSPDDFKASSKDEDLTANDQKDLAELLSLPKKRANYLANKMHAFVNGFGLIFYEDILLTVAQMRERKKDYDFEPVIVNCDNGIMDEFIDFLDFLENHGPITVPFILYSTHTFAGLLTIDDDHNIKIWLIDSIGLKEQDETENPQDYFEIDEHVFIAIAQSLPDAKIFFTREKRQNSLVGCPVFAINDIKFLYRPHLQDKYRDSGIWGYLEDASTRESAKKIELTIPLAETNQSDVEDEEVEDEEDVEDSVKLEIIACDMPLSLMRSMQSRKLLTDVIPKRDKEEQDLRINKKGQTTPASAVSFFKSDSGIEQNTRIQYKLEQMRRDTWNFIRNKTKDQIKELTDYFTVETFTERLESQKAKRFKH